MEIMPLPTFNEVNILLLFNYNVFVCKLSLFRRDEQYTGQKTLGFGGF